MNIKIETVNAITFFKTEARGTSYLAQYVESRSEWEVHSQRSALGRSNVGTFRYFKSAAEVAEKVKAFRDLPLTLQAN